MKRGGCVYAAALDTKKAFDKVNHFKLFSILLDASIPIPVVDDICNWYSKIVSWLMFNGTFSTNQQSYLFLCGGMVALELGCLSSPLLVGSGVRQGSTLSPALSNLYINRTIMSLKTADYGCHVHDKFFGCFLNATISIFYHSH